MADLSCSVRDGTDIITAPPELDVYTCPSLREVTGNPELLARARLVIDLSATTFMDTWGVGVLVGALKRISEAGGSMGIVCTRESVLRIIRIMGLDRVLLVYDTVDEAVRAAKEAAGG